MYITSLEVTRDNQNRAINFTLEAQEIRTADTFSMATSAAQNAAIATAGQTDGETDKGTQEGEEVEESLSTNLGQMFGWIPE
jgi:ribosomal protein L12E/L44/L45/RPP1/RPP2